MNIEEQLATRLDELAKQYRDIRARSQYDDLSDLSESDVHRQVTLTRAAIERSAPKESAYVKQVEDVLTRKNLFDGNKLALLAGIAESLSIDLRAGYLKTVEELIHGNLFSDFLEMATHLLDGGYKDAAAVVCGSTLESHVRQLCIKHGVSTTNTVSGKNSPKKADLLNSELVKANAYSLLDQKNVTAWLDLRNKAAHGHYGEYKKEQVAIMISGVMDFITRNAA